MTKRFPNTFAPDCDNEELTIGMIIQGLFRTLWTYDELPKEIQDAVDEEMDLKEIRKLQSEKHV